MPWGKGQSGNPGGRKKGATTKLLTDSLRKLLAVTLEDGRVTRDAIAQGLIDLAMKADSAETRLGATKVIFDRIDGKVPEPIQLQGHDGGSLAVPILPDYRAALAALAPGPVAHSLPPGEAEVSGNGKTVG